MTLGFTGTSKGMASRQMKAVRQLLWKTKVLHLGDCIGADAEAHEIAVSFGIKTVGHPPLLLHSRAFLSYDEERQPYSFLIRNEHIAHEGVDGLIAAPKEWVEILRSGTWSTVRRARKLHRRIWIVRPDGSILHEFVNLGELPSNMVLE